MSFKSLNAYKKGFSLAMDIFEISKSFPKAEIYSLTDQIRRSSRSVCANISEAYRKRMYVKAGLVNLPILTVKTRKLKFGEISPKSVTTFPKKFIMSIQNVAKK